MASTAGRTRRFSANVVSLNSVSFLIYYLSCTDVVDILRFILCLFN